MLQNKPFTYGDWVETDRAEVGIITSIEMTDDDVIIEVCVGRCYRYLSTARLRHLNVRTAPLGLSTRL